MSFVRRLRRLIRRQQAEAEMVEEMRFHLEQRAADYRADGLPERDAEYAAQRRFGNLGLLQERARDTWGWGWLECAWKDLRFAVRRLAASPALSIVAIITLALGVAANTAIFSVINSALLQPLPFAQPEQLVHIWQRGTSGEWGFASPFFFKQWRDHNTLLTDIATHVDDSATLTGKSAPEFLEGLRVSASYLRVLRVAPMLGHDFPTDSDAIGGQHNVVILTHRMWQTRFHSDPGVINRTIVLDEVPHTVIGVLPASGIPRSDVLFLRPFVVDDPTNPMFSNPRAGWVPVIGRLKPGVTLQQLETELDTLQHTLRDQLPAEMRVLSGPVIVPFHEQLTAPMRPTLIMLLGVGSLLLLIACANITSLLLVRAAARQKEMAVRMALGAGVRRIVIQVFAESLVISVIGAALAVVLTLFAVDVLGPVTDAVQPGLSNVQRIMKVKLLGSSLPSMLEPHVDWVVLAYSIGLALATSLASGLIPALRSCRVDLVRDLKQTGRGNSGARNRTQSILVAGQIGLATVLLAGSGLLLRSLYKELAVDPGFDGRHTLGFDLVIPRTRYADTDAAVRLSGEVIRRLSALPGVEAVGATHNPPFRGIGYQEIKLPNADEQQFLVVSHSAIAGDFFRALGIPLHRGRVFTEADNLPDAAPVIILSEMLTHALFGEGDPIGQRVIHNGSREVVGVVGDIRERSLELAGESHFYLPSRNNPWTPAIVVRTKGTTAAVLKKIRETVVSIDPAQPLAHLNPLEEDISRTLHGKRAMLGLVFTFAAGALFLASLGIYGLMSFTVTQRQRDLGIRMALGASQPKVLRMVFRDGMRLALIGLGAGLVVAVAGARLIQSLLFGVSAHDPLVFASIAIVLTTVAALACWLPARRATKVDPLLVLRAD